MLRQRDDHRRGDERDRELMLLVQRQELFEVEPWHGDDRGAGAQAEVHQHLHPVDVEERQDGDEGVVLVQRDGGERLLDVRDESAMGEHDALRQPGRARRIGQHDDVVEVDRHLLGERRRAQRGDRRVAVGLTDHVHLPDGRLRDRGRRRLEEHRHRHQARRTGVDQLVVDFSRRVRRVDRGDHTPGERDGVEGDGVLGTVGRHHGDHLALRQPGVQPAARLPAHGVLELAVGHRPARGPVDEGGFARQPTGVLEDVRRQRHGREADRRQSARKCHRLPLRSVAGSRPTSLGPPMRGRRVRPRPFSR